MAPMWQRKRDDQHQDRANRRAGRGAGRAEGGGRPGPDEQVERRAPDQPTDLAKKSWVAVLKRTVAEFKDDELADRSAALTYYGILALFPALLVLVSLLGIAGESATKSILDNIAKLTPGAARDIITKAVTQLQAGSGTGSVLAIVGLPYVESRDTRTWSDKDRREMGDR
jgi:membrane protein